jgi:choline dehydrogenase-like flavoprotein
MVAPSLGYFVEGFQKGLRPEDRQPQSKEDIMPSHKQQQSIPVIHDNQVDDLEALEFCRRQMTALEDMIGVDQRLVSRAKSELDRRISAARHRMS